MLLGKAGIRQYFETGKGSVRVRGKAGVEELKGQPRADRHQPRSLQREPGGSRGTNRGLVNEKIITEVSAIRDESDENTRVVVELKRDANPKVVINNLYKHTALESSFSVAMLAIDRGKPKLLSLKEAIACYIEHRREVVLRRTRFLLRQAEDRAEALEGYLIALANIDEFIRIIRDSNNRDDAKAKLLGLSWTRRAVEQIGILLRDARGSRTTAIRLRSGR